MEKIKTSRDIAEQAVGTAIAKGFLLGVKMAAEQADQQEKLHTDYSSDYEQGQRDEAKFIAQKIRMLAERIKH